MLTMGATVSWIHPEPEGLGALTSAALGGCQEQFDRYIVFPHDEARDAVVLWGLHTHVFKAFESTPRLSIRSKEPASGKSRVLEVLNELVPAPLYAVDLEPAVLWRAIEHGQRTLIIDEADTIFGKVGRSSAHVRLRGILNQGHRANGSVPRCVGSEDIYEFNVFAPAVLAGLGRLPETLYTRAVEVAMRKRREGDRQVQPFRLRFAKDDLKRARGKVEAWAQQAIKVLERELPEMPVTDRKADVWEPLVAIADMAGGDWPERARKACLKLTAEADDKKDSVGVRLIGDIRTVFGDAEVLTVRQAKTQLVTVDQLWKDYDPTSLLREQFGIEPTTVRMDGKPARAWKRSEFEDAWSVYLKPMANEETESDDE